MRTGARGGGGRLRRAALAVGLVALSTVVISTVVSPASAGSPPPPKFLGPLLSRSENPNVTLGRDGGFTVPLPNGKDLWIFADTPRLEWIRGAWRLRAYFGGSSAAVMPYTPGRPPASRVSEIAPGKQLGPNANAAPFIPRPESVYMPDGSGKRCTKANGQASTNAVRWPVGGAVLPDKTNVLIPYVIACVQSSYFYTAEGWGFTRYNWKTNKLTQSPLDVFPAHVDGSGLSSTYYFGSPVIVGKKVTFYSWACCNTSDGGVYRTTLDLAALKNPASYVPQRIPNVAMTFDPTVGHRSKTHSLYTMFVKTDFKGGYVLYASSSPQGPWKVKGSGVLPRCDNSPVPCHSLILHPELSPAGRLLISYHLPGFGPGDPSKHPYPHEPLRHVVLASVPCSC